MERLNIRDLGGDYPILPVVLMTFQTTQDDESGQTFGEYDGAVFVTGFSNAVENTITDSVSGKEYFMSRAGAATGLWAYCALEED